MAVLVAHTAALLAPPTATAAPTVTDPSTAAACRCEYQATETKTEALSNGLNLTTVLAADGVERRFATKTMVRGPEKQTYFWLIQNDAQLEQLEAALSVEAPSQLVQPLPGAAAPSGSAGLPAGGWVRWNAQTIRIYISHDLATIWVLGTAVAAIICGIVAILPMATLPGAVCALVFGLSSAVISYWDSVGQPGFYIVGTVSPLSVRIQP
jgi:uncharacterized membrane protein YphA (DoxX/SURF4 family)